MLRVNALLLFLLLSSVSGGTEKHPSAKDVNNLNEVAKQTTNAFYQNSFEIRMRYEFANRFFSEDDRIKLLNAAQNNAQKLTEIIDQYEKYIHQIESYHGDDWEQRYGQTGLYRNASNYLLNTWLSKFGIDYYTALASEDKEKTAVARKLLRQIDSFTQAQGSFYLQLVKGKTLVLLAKTDPNYGLAAERVFSELHERSDTSQRLAFMASIEGTRLESAQKDIEANRLARDLMNVELRNDIEILLPIAFVQRRLGKIDIYNDLLQSNEQAHAVAAGITLAWLEAGNEPVNPLDAELAAEAALRDDPKKHKEVLLKLANKNSSASPVVDYAAAVTVADSNEPEAVYLLIRAGTVLDAQSAKILGLTGEQIAAYAAKLAYRVFVKDPNRCELATEAFENYFELAEQKADPNLQYTYTQVLALCGEHSKAVDMLRKIPPSAKELYPKAQLDLMSAQIASGLHYLIFHRTMYATLFSQYLRDTSDCVYVEPATTLLQGYLEEIEVLETDQPTYIHTVKDSKKIAGFLYDCIQDQSRVSILAEFTALDPCATDKELTAAEEMLTKSPDSGADLNMLRASARLASRKNDFGEAARLWERTAQENTSANQTSRSWQWWRATYYQLECAAKAGQDSKAIIHAIDVLRATHTDIPEIWAQKLESLQKDCGG